MSERITGVEGTKLNNEFQDMERRTDLFNELVCVNATKIIKTFFERGDFIVKLKIRQFYRLDRF